MKTILHLHPWSLNVWCDIVTDCVIGLYFFENYLNGPMYANFLRDVLSKLLEDIPLNINIDIWMQHDNAPPHNAMCFKLMLKS